MKDTIKEAMSILGKRSAAKLTPEERSERARNAVQTRWQKTKDKTKVGII